MLSFIKICKNLEQLVEIENNNRNSSTVIKLKGKTYFTNLEKRYNCTLEDYKKSIGIHEVKQDYCALAFFFEAMMKWAKREFPIDLVDENGKIFTEMHNRRVNAETLKETLKRYTVSLMVNLVVEILNPEISNKVKDELTKSLEKEELNKKYNLIIPLFHNLSY